MRRVTAATQLALWVGRKGRGSAHLRWAGRELIVYVSGLQIVGVLGDEGGGLEAAIGLAPKGEWFAEVSSAVAAGQLSQAEANAVLKRSLAQVVGEFLRATDATVSFDSRPLTEPQGLTISYPHLVVELILAGDGEDLVPVFLPDETLILRRLPDFPRRVGALALTDEAMAIFAKINDQRSAQEIADPSPHGRDLAMRLLATAVGAGLVEASPRVSDVPLAMEPVEEELPSARRRVWLWLLILVTLALAVAAVMAFLPRSGNSATGTKGPWAVAVDMGCQSAEMERLYRKQERDREAYRLVKFQNGDVPCMRLVWGSFPDRASAEQAARGLPSGVLTRGFGPHAVLVETPSP